jgi:predicted AAA+ superfamily ATPase
MIPRENYLEQLRQLRDEKVIKVITGIRRSGKSTLLELFKAELIESGVDKSQIIDINFEDDENEWLLDRHILSKHIKDNMVVGKMNYIFLDEIQNVPQFEKLVDSFHIRKNVDIYITGSNAYLLSSDLATLLSGRYIEISILPFSFAEFVQSFSDKTEPTKRFNEYIHYSSFPQAVSWIENTPDRINGYLKGIYNSVLKKDIMKRRGIKSERNFENVLKFALDSVGSPVSPNSIAEALTAEDQTIKSSTVDNYLEALTGSFVMYKANRWDIKGKKLLRTQEKYYAVDVGLRRVLLGRQNNTDIGHILENVIYLELLRRGGEVFIGKTSTGKEIDFVVKSPDGDISYYQVAASVMNEDTLERELAPLRQVQATDNYPKYLITLDTIPFDENGIKHINAIDWLLNRVKKGNN